MPVQTIGRDPELLLSTWFFLYLHPNRSVGGLPNEFLTDGSTALLLFDTIGCDANALAWEKRFAGKWVSSDLYAALQDEGILKPVDMQAVAAKTILPHLRNAGAIDAHMDLMHRELDMIRSGRRPPERMGIPSALKQLNKGMFASLGVEFPSSALYSGGENYFRPSRPGKGAGARTSDIGRSKGGRRFFSAMKAVLPAFALLSRIEGDTEAGAALRRSMLKEKPIVLRYAFGDPDVTLDKILEYRLGREFRQDDALIDEPRRKAAERNLKRLLKIRQRTTDVRDAVRVAIADVALGRRTAVNVKKDIQQAQRALAAHVADSGSFRVDLRLAKAAVAAVALEGAAALAGLHVFPIPTLAISTSEYFRKRAEDQHLTELRQRYPLAFFVGEIDGAG